MWSKVMAARMLLPPLASVPGVLLRGLRGCHQARSPLQVKSPQQEMSSPRQSPRSPQPLSRVTRDPPSRVARNPPAPNSQSPPTQPISLPSSEPSSDPFDVMRSMKRGKRKLDEDQEEALVPNQPPLKLKLSLTKS